MSFRKGLSFDDVLLIPRYSDITSRKKGVSISSMLGSINLDIPIISSPMDTVTESAMALEMDNLGGLGIIHRYNTANEQAGIVRSCHGKNVGAAIGVTGDYLERALTVVKAGANVLCIDIAHGDHILMENAIEMRSDELMTEVGFKQ